MDRKAREVWAERIEKLKESGLTQREFASQVGINRRESFVVEVAARVEGVRDGAEAQAP